MKYTLLRVLIGITILLVGILIGLNIYSPYDANRDGKVSAVDYVVIKNYILERGENNEE